jgi:hypothetical protein
MPRAKAGRQDLRQLSELTDHRNDEKYSQWQEDYQEFVTSKTDYLKSQTNIEYYLMLLSDDDYKTVIEVKDSSILFEGRNKAMLENLGINFDEMGDCNLIIIENGTSNILYENVLYELTENNERIRITVMSKTTGEVIDIKTF